MAVKGDHFDKLVHDVEADFFVRLLPPAKAQLNADFQVVAKELDGVGTFCRQVVSIDGWGDLKFLHSPGGIMGSGSLVPLGFFVKEFAIIHNSADGRSGVGRDFDQIQALGAGWALGKSATSRPPARPWW